VVPRYPARRGARLLARLVVRPSREVRFRRFLCRREHSSYFRQTRKDKIGSRKKPGNAPGFRLEDVVLLLAALVALLATLLTALLATALLLLTGLLSALLSAALLATLVLLATLTLLVVLVLVCHVNILTSGWN